MTSLYRYFAEDQVEGSLEDKIELIEASADRTVALLSKQIQDSN